MSKESILVSIYKEVCAKFDIPEYRSRRADIVAVRAAYCVIMNKTKSFSLKAIGGSMIHTCKKTKQKTWLDHSTVIHLLKKADWGNYDDIPQYKSALLFIERLVADKFIENIEKEKQYKTISSYDAIMSSALQRKVELLERRNEQLEAKVAILARRLKYRNNIKVNNLVNKINQANRIMHSLGYDTIPTSDIQELYKFSTDKEVSIDEVEEDIMLRYFSNNKELIKN